MATEEKGEKVVQIAARERGESWRSYKFQARSKSSSFNLKSVVDGSSKTGSNIGINFIPRKCV